MPPDDAALRDDLLASIEACRRLKYNPGYFARMIAERGAVGAARSLLAAPEVSQGFTRLYLLQAEHGPKVMEHCVEAIVLKPQHRGLFTPTELDVALQRLKQADLVPPWAQGDGEAGGAGVIPEE